ncbi:helix-turn-helix transcriptional regulator [Brachybacterium tyrofermentans]|uniref:helix-turn-helix transcriptional regulator n=1 Tax=Brachybacterium tyrofermentans TaxID=47848 RepID=UPI0018696C52|nr:helix-turn-helix domain-containing protein [Brachybacterium tyrofermentans]
MTEDRLLTETEAAHMLGLKPETLRHWRSTGAPHQPTPIRIGRSVRYRLSTLTAWMDELEATVAA